MDASSESEPERFYVGRGDQTFGPYAAAEIQQYWNDQQLVEGDHIWLATEERWVPISEFLNRSSPSQIQDPPPAELIPEDACISQSPKSAPLCFCQAHPDTYAVGHCHRCTKFLCAQCVRYRAGGFYCAECVKFAEGRVEKGTSGFMEQVIHGTGHSGFPGTPGIRRLPDADRLFVSVRDDGGDEGSQDQGRPAGGDRDVSGSELAGPADGRPVFGTGGDTAIQPLVPAPIRRGRSCGGGQDGGRRRSRPVHRDADPRGPSEG